MGDIKTDVAILTSDGQITLPQKSLDILKVSVGERITFIYEDGYVVMANPIVYAFRKMQKSMKGEFEKAGIKSDEDILEICRQIRKEIEGN
jgi:bifunctional DNA-binding transcriptional regulator/antitoxin component of YhaV-PrlF toxin-antitoxin module